MQPAIRPSETDTDSVLSDIQTVPGHLIRRCQQIAVAIFLDEFRTIGLKPVQYAALATVYRQPGIDQRTLVNLIAVDRSTIGAILKDLEGQGLIKRVTPRHNLRVKQLHILPAGEEMLRQSQDLISKVQERILAPLKPADQAQFLHLLAQVVEGNNELSRVPFKALAENASG